MWRRVALCWLLGAVLGAPVARAAEEPPELAAVRVEAPPVIDGALDDPCWQQSSHAEGFSRMAKPGPGLEPTEAWICYDSRNVYVAFYCHDSHPQQIHALQRKRNGDISVDDSVLLSLDVGHDRRTTYSFQLTPRGTQREEIPGGSAEKYEWRGDWTGAARITSDGWTAEMAIPFAILRYPPGQTVFGVHFARYLARMSDWSSWPDLGQGGQTLDLTREADWAGLATPAIRPPAILMPYVVGNLGNSSEEKAVAGGLDAKYVAPIGLVSVLSYKPDFRNIEDVVENIDFTYTQRQFPEYRPFFMEGGGQQSEWGEPAGSFYPPTMIFYSRSIPFVDLGAKIFGKLGRHSIGLLDAVEPGGVGDLVTGYGYDLGDRGKVRLGLVDHRDPEGLDNTAMHLGTEWMWPEPDGSAQFTANVFQGDTRGPGGDGRAFDLNAWRDRPNGLGWWGWYQDVGRDFQTVTEQTEWGPIQRQVGVGYVPETGIRGGGFSLYGSRVQDTGSVEHKGWEADTSAFDDPAGPRWALAGGYSVQWRNDTSWQWNLGTGERAGFAERGLDFTRDWHNKDLYTRGSFGGTLGTRLGGPYRFLHLSQGYRPTQSFSWQVRLEQVDLNAERSSDNLRGAQALLTATYDLSDEKSVTARAVYRRGNSNFWLPQVYYDPAKMPSEFSGGSPDAQVGKLNLYAAYRQRVAHGRDIFVILGDPNAASTQASIAIKLVWTHVL
jgi:hypothetical protein